VPTPNGSLKLLILEIRWRNPLMPIKKAKGKLLTVKKVSKNQCGYLASMAQADLVTPDPVPVTIRTGSRKIIKPTLEQCLTTALMVPPIPVPTLLTCDP
jgi:hypothetical protein